MTAAARTSRPVPVMSWPTIDEVRRSLAAGGSASSLRALMAVHLHGLDTLEPSLRRARLDDVLVEFAARLTEMVRRSDTVARVGPAEFALLIDTPSGADADGLARRIVERISRPLLHEGQPLTVRASVGWRCRRRPMTPTS